MRHLAWLFALTLLAGCSGPTAESPSPDPPASVEAPAGMGGAGTPGTEAVRAPHADGATPTASACDWRRIALPEHRRQVEVTTASLRQRFQVESADAERLAALLARPALPLGGIAGGWRVRSLQLHDGTVYAYPFFDARIEADPCGHRFAKTTGSQRRSGVLYPIEGTPDRLAFLGAATVNDDPPRAYDPERPVETQFPGDANSAGWLQRIGPDELLMVFDAEPGRFEAYLLQK